MWPIVTDVAWSAGLSVTIMSTSKAAEPIEMPFGLWTRVGPSYHVLDGVPGVQMSVTEGAATAMRPFVKLFSPRFFKFANFNEF